MKSGLILKIVVAFIFVLGIAGMIMVATAGADNSPEMASAASYVVTLAVTLLIIAGILAVVSSLYSIFQNPEGLKKTLLGLVVLLVLFVVSYFAASNAEVFGAGGGKLLEEGSVSKLTGAGLNFSYILLVVGSVFFVIDLVKGLIKS